MATATRRTRPLPSDPFPYAGAAARVTRRAAVAALVLVCPAAGREQAPGAAAREVAAVEARVDTALARLVADSFTFVHAMDGRVDTREAWLADAARGVAQSRQRNARIAFDTTLTVYGGHTAVRTSRVRLRIAAASREPWLQQTMVYVREPDGWRLAYGQGTRIYDGPVLDTTLYRRYAGRETSTTGGAATRVQSGGAKAGAWFVGGAVVSLATSRPLKGLPDYPLQPLQGTCASPESPCLTIAPNTELSETASHLGLGALNAGPLAACGLLGPVLDDAFQTPAASGCTPHQVL